MVIGFPARTRAAGGAIDIGQMEPPPVPRKRDAGAVQSNISAPIVNHHAHPRFQGARERRQSQHRATRGGNPQVEAQP